MEEKKIYECPHCDKTFKRKQNLDWHMKFKHANPLENPKEEKDEDVCPACKSDLEVVENMGNNKFRVQCVNCKKRYIWSED